MISLCLLGASGSIGKQTVDVINKNPNDFKLVAFSVGTKTRNVCSLLNKHPDCKYVYIKDEKNAKKYQKLFKNRFFYSEKDGFEQLISVSNPDMVVNALVGFVGLKPSLIALEQNRMLALANKESLVVGGELINQVLKRGKGKLFPIDSEHVALSKCLKVDSNDVKRIILTASGGAFRDLTRKELKDVKAIDALKHPTWKMGTKITIDCANMINKCFEIIEAHYLFNYPSSKIDVIIHKQSRVHSMVEYNNGLYRMDISKPDMRIPIKYALYQTEIPFETYVTDDYHNLKEYDFSEISYERFPLIKWGKYIIDQKGTYGAVFNASSEVAVNAYLKDEISFLMIEDIVNTFMEHHKNVLHPSYDKLLEVDRLTREAVKKFIHEKRNN